jgi:hypothetical protein
MTLRRREVLAALPLLALAPSARAGTAPAGDREVLAEALRLETGLSSLYRELAREGGPAAREAALFGRQCEEHARGLRIALASRGGRPEPADPAAPPAAGPAAAIELERATVAAYYRAHADFGDLAFLPTLSSIMANHGQHLAVLRERLGQEPVTRAFETGGVE